MMALPKVTSINSSPPSAQAKEVAQLLVGILKPLTEKIRVIHRSEIIHIVYTSSDHDAMNNRLDCLFDSCLISQRLVRDNLESDDVLLLNHVASGLRINIYAAY